MAVRNVVSKSSKVYSLEEFQQRIQARLQDPDIAHWSDLTHLLHYPNRHELWMDYLLNPLDGPFWQEDHCMDVAPQVDIRVYFQIKWGLGC